ncbi:MAG: hypothetical protein KZQ93_21095 [Candidatus Thiodiazotropha sp. (ex Monitilora ramsayi)]|nr:hypothetical protein [Candidatus Thiodiazotropha sp. (ex Monitilora ramsayi)]
MPTYKDEMTRFLRTLLVLCFLTAQVGWVDHLYHQHDLDRGEECEQCLVGHAQKHAVVSSYHDTALNPTFVTDPIPSVSGCFRDWIAPYLSRAPPLCI